jgi:hypothetical protein
MTDYDALREEIQRERERLNAFERKLDLMSKTHDKILEVMQGDSAWKRKGVIDQLAELADFMATMKGFDFAEMKGFAAEYKDFKKRILTIGAVLSGLTGGVWLIIANMEKIAKLFHH